MPDVLVFLRARLAELRAALRDPSRPLPPWIWFGLAGLVSLAFFLWLRLVAVRMAPPERAAGLPSTSPAPGASPRLATTLEPVRPSSSTAAIAARVEEWRQARAARDLAGWLALYARTYGAGGRDLAGLAERAAGEFAGGDPLVITVSGLAVTPGADIVVASLVETREQALQSVRERVRLYFLLEDGAWKIFNEERAAIEPGSEGP